MKDHTKVCWHCGSNDMKPVETWYQCHDCGATTDNVHQPGSPAVTVVDDETGGAPKVKSYSRGRPSGRAMSRATRARKEAQEESESHAGASS